MEVIPKEKLENLLSQFALTDRVAVVTGGSRGLGRGIALALAAAGAHVVPVSRTQADLDAVAEEIRTLGSRALSVAVDVTIETQVQEMVQRVVDEFGHIDILVNSAGIVSLKPTTEFPLEEWREIIRVKSVKNRMLEPGYGYVRITNFQSRTTTDLLKAVSDLQKEERLKGMVLDLRNNPGGVLNGAVGVSDAFIDDGLIVYTEGRLDERYGADRRGRTGPRPEWQLHRRHQRTPIHLRRHGHA